MSFKQTWWDSNLTTQFDQFKNWVGDSNAESKVYFRNYIKKFNFKNVLDVGCGPATEFYGFQKDNIILDYTGVDSSKILNQINTEKGIPMILSDADKIPVNDSSYELVFSRHVLEHQPSYEGVLSEMIRCASIMAAHIFFIKPLNEPTKIVFDKDSNLYHNVYSREDIENYLNSNKKVSHYDWLEINHNENLLVIFIEKD
jgi:ubiquinone/menaquinone biosynthesis C-methylase UbiE